MGGWAVPLEWWGDPGRRHAVRTAVKAMMAQLQASVLLVLPDSHGQATSRFRGHWTCGQPLGDGSCGGWPPANGGH